MPAKPKYDYKRVKELSRKRLGLEIIATLLKVPEAVFREDLRTDPDLKLAMDEGKAVALEKAVNTVFSAMDGSMVGADKDKNTLRYKAALDFLDRHSPEWRFQK